MQSDREVRNVVARRPPNRKALIRSTAAELFGDRGFHNVSMAEVAQAVGITAPALYRHFRNKQELLLASVLYAVETVGAVGENAATLDEFIQGLTALSLDRPGIGTLWQREARHLGSAEREAILAHAEQVLAPVVVLLRAHRPELDQNDLALLGIALLGLFSGRAGRRRALPKRRYEQLMHRLAHAVVQVRLGTAEEEDAPVQEPKGAGSAGVTLPRRDQLLDEAVRLFDERGFQSVSLADIAEAAGVARTATYWYFENKDELLVAAANAAGERMRQGVKDALVGAREPQQALELLLRSHVAVTRENDRLVAILADERDQLPDADQKRYQRYQDDMLDIWLQALGNAAPDRDQAEARVAVQSTQAMVYFTIRSRYTGDRRDLQQRLTELGLATLHGW